MVAVTCFSLLGCGGSATHSESPTQKDEPEHQFQAERDVSEEGVVEQSAASEAPPDVTSPPAETMSIDVPSGFDSKSCAAKVRWMRDGLGEPVESVPVVVIESQIPRVRGGQPVDAPGQVVNVQANFPTVLDGKNLGVRGDEARAVLAKQVKKGKPLYVAANTSVSASYVANLVADAAGRASSVRLLVQAPPPLRPAVDPQRMVELIRQAAGSCDAILSVLGRAGSRLPSKRAAFIQAEIPKAVESCKCGDTDVGQLTVMLFSMVADAPVYSYFEFNTAEPFDGSVQDLAVKLAQEALR